MPIFKCSECGCIDNTATGNYWTAKYENMPTLCTECDPEIKKWHGRFKKQKAEPNYVEGEDGFYYHKDELKPGGYFHGRVNPRHP